MKNITVTVDDELYRMARVKAAERDTSVSRLVREFLKSLAEGESDFQRRKRLQDQVLASLDLREPVEGAPRLSRDEVHHRRAVR